MLEFEKQKEKCKFEKKYISLRKILEFEKNTWVWENTQVWEKCINKENLQI